MQHTNISFMDISFFRTDCETGHSKEQTIECEQCCEGETPALAEWKCLDCRFPLCEKCRKQHLQIPILKRKLDHLVPWKEKEFCSLQPDVLKICIMSHKSVIN